MAEKRKYEVVHSIRIERRKRLKIGAVVELDAAQAHAWAHAVRLLPEEVQTQESTPEQEQAPQVEPTDESEEAGGTSEATDEPRITEGAQEEAERLGISLEHVRATGVNNTLTKKDVQREAKRIREANEE